jgi:hypothetical protein
MQEQILPWFLQPVKAERYKLVLPFVGLTMLLAAGLIYFTGWTIRQERQNLYEQQLGLAAAQFSDSFSQQEVLHLASLRLLRFTQGMTEAIVRANREQLLTLTFPVAVNQGVDWVIVTDAQGQSLLQLRQREGIDYLTLTDPVQLDWDIVGKARTGEIIEGNDKFAAIIDVDGTLFFLTAAAVLPSQNSAPVGTVIVGTNLESFLADLKRRTQADFTIYDLDGVPRFTTLAQDQEARQALQLKQSVLDYLQGPSLLVARSSVPETGVRVGDRAYDLLISDLSVGTEAAGNSGLFSAAFPAGGKGTAGSGYQLTLLAVFSVLGLLVLNIGYFVATRLVVPL